VRCADRQQYTVTAQSVLPSVESLCLQCAVQQYTVTAQSVLPSVESLCLQCGPPAVHGDRAVGAALC